MPDDDIPLTGAVRDKLVRTKERWAEEGRLLTGTHGDPARDRWTPVIRDLGIRLA